MLICSSLLEKENEEAEGRRRRRRRRRRKGQLIRKLPLQRRSIRQVPSVGTSMECALTRNLGGDVTVGTAVAYSETERGRERQTETDREREPDRQTDRERERERGAPTAQIYYCRQVPEKSIL